MPTETTDEPTDEPTDKPTDKPTGEPAQSLIGRNETMEIQRTGYRAYLAGIPPQDNPYTRESAESIERQTAWFRGYAMSKTDRARANRAAAAGSASAEGAQAASAEGAGGGAG